MATPRRLPAPPGPKGSPIYGILREYRKDPLGTMFKNVNTYGEIVRFPFGPIYYYLLWHPDHVQHVLQNNHRNYGKSTYSWKKMRPLLGMGLLTSEGDFWLRQRRIAQPAFHRERVAGFGTTMTDLTKEMLDAWDRREKPDAPIDVAVEMMRLTLRVVGKTLLSVDMADKSDEVGEALTYALKQIMERIHEPLSFLPLFVPTLENRRYKKAIATLDAVVMDAIRARRAGGKDEDLLSMLLHSKDDETGESMSDQQLRDEVMTIFLAGYETTSNALTWTWYLLSKHPQAERQVRKELETELGGRVPTMADLGKLRYTRMVIQESMRLFPPAWMTERSAIGEDEIGGFRIPKGAAVLVSSYITHRHPAFWENPEGFDPERFEPSRMKSLPRFAYFPFGGGPRQCIGNEFAMMEAMLILATVLQRYTLHLIPGKTAEPEPVITLRPKGGMPMTARRVD
ncbi:MAG: cytochrome P450 [Elusimicrobia bacterium]|nr:cytochrome P450 [Elusimicrobiota bacterium]